MTRSTPQPQRGKKRRASLKVRLLALLFAIVFGLVLLEIGARVAAAVGLVQIRQFDTEEGVKRLDFVADISDVTGVWHLPGASVEVPGADGPVRYETNAHGMRDRPREKESSAPRRLVVLGDSFVEGWMVPAEDRFTDVLEKKLGIEFLNFGCSGDFGTIQEWLLYRNVASQFDHSEVALFFLPDNDFKDNDPERNSSTRYRPYLRVPEGGGEFEVYYPREFRRVTTKRVRLSAGKKFRYRMYNRSHFFNLLSNINFHSDTQTAYSGFGDDDWARVEFSLSRLAEDAGASRRLTVFIIPRADDLRLADDELGSPTITEKLTDWAAEQPGDVRVVDMKPGFREWLKKDGNQLRALFIPGDGHWTKLGHAVAAEIVAAELAQPVGG